MKRLWRWLVGCEHDWQNTGAFYQGPGARLVLKQCSKCPEVVIVKQ